MTMGLVCLSCLAWASSEEGAHHVMAPDWNLFIAGVNFVLLVAVLVYFLKKPLADYFQVRSQAIKESIEVSRKAHEQASQEYRIIADKLKNIAQEKEDLLNAFRDQGELEKKRIIEDAKAYAERIREDAKKIAEQELLKAKNALKALTIKMTEDLAKKIVEEEISDDDQKRLSESYLGRMKGIV